MSAAAAVIGDAALARWLCKKVPEAILTGQPLPPRPTVQAPARLGDGNALAGVAVALVVAAATFWLAYDGGAYRLESRTTVAIVVWWTIALGLVTGVLPRARSTPAAWLVGGLLALFAAWTGVSIAWAESDEKAFNEFNRVTLYLGVFALVALAARSTETHRWVDGLGVGVAAIATFALVSRLFPDHFPQGNAHGFLGETLNYPVGYSNGLSVLAALGVPLLLRYAAVHARSHPWLAGIAVSFIPILASVLFLAASRGATAAALIGATVLLILIDDRGPLLGVLVITGAAAAAAVAILWDRSALQNQPLTDAAAQEGHRAALLLFAVSLGAGLAFAGGALLMRRTSLRLPLLPGWAVLSVLLGISLAVAFAANPIGRFDDFKRSPTGQEQTEENPGRSHLLSINSTGRWQFWQGAYAQFEDEPLHGGGAGSFETWWAQHGSIGVFVLDAHSLYLETMGELGIVGFALLVATFATGVGLAIFRVRRTQGVERTDVAAALAAFVAYLFAAGLDWMWELPAITAVAIACLALTAGGGSPQRGVNPLARGTGIVAALVIVAAQGVALLATYELNESRRAVERGDTLVAIDRALAARSLEPWASSPPLQLALVSEQAGDLSAASRWIEEAILEDRTDWRLWLVSARIATKSGSIQIARTSLARAAELNPRSGLFADYVRRRPSLRSP